MTVHVCFYKCTNVFYCYIGVLYIFMFLLVPCKWFSYSLFSCMWEVRYLCLCLHQCSIFYAYDHHKSSRSFIHRHIYIANFAIFKIATFWSYHLHLRENSRSFVKLKLREFLVGSAHVRSQATVHAFMHAWGPRISIHVSKSARS